MREITGVSATSVNNYIRDAGKVIFNVTVADLRTAVDIAAVKTALGAGTELGAVRGGSNFSLNRTFRQMPADGLLGRTKGHRRLESVEPTLTVNPIEITAATLTKAIAGASGSDTAGGALQEITGGDLSDSDYIDNVVFLTHHRNTDEPVIFVLENCIAGNAPTFSTADNDEMVLSIEFEGHFDPGSPGVEPWRLFTHETVA